MKKKVFKVSDFREALQKLTERSPFRSPNRQDINYLEVWNALGQMTDEELLDAKLYADLGMDSLNLAEMITYIEFGFGKYVPDDIHNTLGTGVSVTVRKFLDAINSEG